MTLHERPIEELFRSLRWALDPMSAVNVAGAQGYPYLALIDELERRFLDLNRRETRRKD